MEKASTRGHLCALWSILIWGTTFVVTKVLLDKFTPAEILFTRFSAAWVLLMILDHSRVKTKSFKEELMFASAGLFGVVVYFLFENTALTYITASAVGILVSVSPFFTALISKVFLGERTKRYFFAGFVLAMAGITLVNLNGGVEGALDFKGLILACGAALSWAVYSTITKKISSWGIKAVPMTRHIFFYAIIICIPVLCFMGFDVKLHELYESKVLLSFAFLGFLGSGICYVTWNSALKILGAVKTSVYIYLIPVVTVIFSVIFLKERITLMELCGIGLIFTGLFISDKDRLFMPQRSASKHAHQSAEQ